MQKYDGDSDVTDVLYSCVQDYQAVAGAVEEEDLLVIMPVGVILMSPEGEFSLHVFNPDTDGGLRGYQVKKGWTMQTVLLPGSKLTFFDYWSPKGFCSPVDEDGLYGLKVLTEVKDEAVLERFQIMREELVTHLKTLVM